MNDLFVIIGSLLALGMTIAGIWLIRKIKKHTLLKSKSQILLFVYKNGSDIQSATKGRFRVRKNNNDNRIHRKHLVYELCHNNDF